MGDRRSVACRSKRWAGSHFSESVDWRRTLLNAQLYRYRFSTVFLCPRANAIQPRRESLWSHSQWAQPWQEESEIKKGRQGGKGRKGVRMCIKQLPYRYNYKLKYFYISDAWNENSYTWTSANRTKKRKPCKVYLLHWCNLKDAKSKTKLSLWGSKTRGKTIQTFIDEPDVSYVDDHMFVPII